MLKRKWEGDLGCYFYGEAESAEHLLFTCHLAKVVWRVIAICFLKNTRPCSYAQHWPWIVDALPGESKIYMLGLAAVCWAIWKAHNKTCFEKKNPIKSPSEVLFSV
jgi:hypothetical protein